MRTAPFEGYHVLGPEPKVPKNRVCAVRQADRMAGSSVTFTQKHRESRSSTKVTSSRKTTSRTSVFDRLVSPTHTTTPRTVTQEPPLRAGAGRGARHRPYPDGRKKSGKASASSATRQCWRVPGGGSPGGLCPALAESAGQLPGHQRCWGCDGHCIPATASTHALVHQLPDQKQPAGPPATVDALLMKGSIERVTNVTSPGYHSWLVLVPKKTGDLRPIIRPLHFQLPRGSSTLQDGDARVRPLSHQKSGVDGMDSHTWCLRSCSYAPGRPQVTTLRGQQESVPIHLSSIWAGDPPREFTKLLRPVVLLFRQQGVKLHVYLDDWLIRADTPEQAKLHAQTTIRVLQFLGWIINYEKSDLTPSQTSSSSRCSSTLDNSQWRPCRRCV